MGWGSRIADSLVTGAAASSGVPTTQLRGASTRTVEASLVPPGTLELASPWAPASPQLTQILWADTFGAVGKTMATTRDTAMQVPALARARHLLCGFGARAVLRAYLEDSEELAPTRPDWMRKASGGVSPFHRMLWTLDDLLFRGWSLWDVERNTADGPITGQAQRVASHRWSFEANTGRILVDAKPMNSKQALLIPGPHEGVLNFGRTAIVQAQELEATATRVAQNPSAYLNLHYTGEVPLTPAQITEARTVWAEARRGDYGGVGFTGKDLAVEELGAAAEHLLVEGRNAAAVNMARAASLPASMVDATNAGASLTYETSAGRNAEFLDYGADLYLDSVAARLSLDDAMPEGQAARFDTAKLRSITPTPTGPED
jgi:hypothetical protein